MNTVTVYFIHSDAQLNLPSSKADVIMKFGVHSFLSESASGNPVLRAVVSYLLKDGVPSPQSCSRDEVRQYLLSAQYLLHQPLSKHFQASALILKHSPSIKHIQV